MAIYGAHHSWRGSRFKAVYHGSPGGLTFVMTEG
jgi:hypothetical protein